MVLLNSGGAALAGTPGLMTSPDAPRDPLDADDADPGSPTSVNAAEAHTPMKIPLSSILPVT
jgi:hypothetical protein